MQYQAKSVMLTNICEVDDHLAKELWDVEHKNNVKNEFNKNTSPSISEMDLE